MIYHECAQIIEYYCSSIPELINHQSIPKIIDHQSSINITDYWSLNINSLSSIKSISITDILSSLHESSICRHHQSSINIKYNRLSIINDKYTHKSSINIYIKKKNHQSLILPKLLYQYFINQHYRLLFLISH
jgi:hypothetical protein